MKRHGKPLSGRLDTLRKTKPQYLLETMMSDPVPESEWHPDDRAQILDCIEKMAKEGIKVCVKRRPDGSFCMMTDPEFIAS